MATIQQAAELTGISEWSIRFLAKSRKIKAICSGRKIFIRMMTKFHDLANDAERIVGHSLTLLIVTHNRKEGDDGVSNET
jgi:hypothetical protein